MNGSLGWPDFVIIVVLALLTLRGLLRGFVAEVAGVVAIAAAFCAAWFYNGAADPIFQQFHLDPGVAHVAGMVLAGAVAYFVVIFIAALLRRIAKLPLLGTGNAIAGAAVGAVKGIVVLWIALFIALLFPLTQQIRADLHRSRLVEILTSQNQFVDGVIYTGLPDPMKPFVKPLLDQQQGP
jgi:membrane protein required for colicin V production